ncbi:MAG: hypothetical protein KGN34_03520 [Sphingomonadales bacterium]|nr:hypothetical protein [Sphingomonadales bacterium]
MTALATGLSASITTTVTAADLACALGSGDVTVLGTPRLVALAEAATVAALAPALEPGQTSVGTHVDIHHLAPTLAGRPVTARAELVTIDGRALTFTVEIHDDQGLVGSGRVERALVQRARFLERALLPR